MANVITPGKCQTTAPGGPYAGYDGLASLSDLHDVSALPFAYGTPPGGGLLSGTRKSNCNTGLLVFKQGDRYGVLDFLSIDAQNALHFDYWLADPGVLDFSAIPSLAAARSR